MLRHKIGFRSDLMKGSYLQQEPFRVLREQHAERLKKVVVVAGDTSVKELSLSAEKKQLVSRVSVIFHMAANVRFDLPLKTCVKINTEGTMNVVALAKQVTMLPTDYVVIFPMPIIVERFIMYIIFVKWINT